MYGSHLSAIMRPLGWEAGLSRPPARYSARRAFSDQGPAMKNMASIRLIGFVATPFDFGGLEFTPVGAAPPGKAAASIEPLYVGRPAALTREIAR